MEPRPPATWASASQQELFTTSQKKARSRPAPGRSEERTVDEIMLSSSYLTLSSAEASGYSELGSLSRTPSFPGAEKSSSGPEASSESEVNSLDEANPGSKSTSHTGGFETDTHEAEETAQRHRDATKENWRLVRKFLTGRQYYPPKRGCFAALLSLPRSRDIVTRPGMKFVADQPKKVRLLIVHMTGEEPSAPCDACALGRGPFKKCIMISQKAAGETTTGIVCCTNCANERSQQRRCNVAELRGQPAVGPVESQSEQRRGRRPAPEPREQASLGIDSRTTNVDSRFTFAVHVLPLDGSLELDSDPSGVRLCSLAAGKVMVELEGNSPFLIGPHGMFKLMPAMTAEVSNASEVDAVLHVSTVQL